MLWLLQCRDRVGGGVLVLVRRLTRRVRDGVAAGVVRAGTGGLERGRLRGWSVLEQEWTGM